MKRCLLRHGNEEFCWLSDFGLSRPLRYQSYSVEEPLEHRPSQSRPSLAYQGSIHWKAYCLSVGSIAGHPSGVWSLCLGIGASSGALSMVRSALPSVVWHFISRPSYTQEEFRINPNTTKTSRFAQSVRCHFTLLSDYGIDSHFYTNSTRFREATRANLPTRIINSDLAL